MALCIKLTSSARFSARTNDAFISTFRRPRRTARFFTNFVACRGIQTQVTNGTKQDREWRIRAVQFDERANLQRFYATCEEGLEEILAAELSSTPINVSQVELGFGGVSFVCTQTTGYNANLWLRTADRVLCELARGLLPPKGRSGVYDFVRAAADWPLLLVDDATSRISQSAKRCKLRKFAVQIKLQNSAEKQASVLASTSNAIWDSLRDGCVQQWPEKGEAGEAVSVPLVFHVDGDSAVLYRDMSGVSLYKRGYGDTTTTTMVQSKEGLAAAVLTIAGWNPMVSGFGEANKNPTQDKNRVLLDPFCGTGTFLIQAALMACHVAPGLMRRHWPFQTWHDYDQKAWTECRDAAASMRVSSLSSSARLIGNDMNEGALAKCKRFARAAGVLHLLDLSCETSRHYRPPCTPSLVVTNPPCAPPLTYSSLRGEDERLRTLWQGFGQFLKSQCRGADVYVLSENDWLTHALHMLPDRKWDMQPHKQWRGKLSGSKNQKLFGSQERKLLHYYVQSRRAQGNPLSAIPFSPLYPNSVQPGLLCENTELQHWR